MVQQQLANSDSKLSEREREANDLLDLFCVIEKANKNLSKQLSLVSLNYYEALNEMEYSRHANNLQKVEKESISEMLRLLFDSNRNLSKLKIEGDKEESQIFKRDKEIELLRSELEVARFECANALD